MPPWLRFAAPAPWLASLQLLQHGAAAHVSPCELRLCFYCSLEEAYVCSKRLLQHIAAVQVSPCELSALTSALRLAWQRYGLDQGTALWRRLVASVLTKQGPDAD